MYEIDKNVPLPPFTRGARFPYEQLEVGDSFYVEGGKLSSICNSNYRVGKRLQAKFTARQEDSGVRVWRVS